MAGRSLRGSLPKSLLCAVPSILGVVLAFLPASRCSANLYLEDYEPNRQSRFYVGGDKAFIGQPFDWSGVGNTNSGGNGQWATMISPSYFVAAAHDAPGPGSTLTFYSTNDPNGPSHTYTVSSTTFQGSYMGLPSDLYIGKLTSPIPASDHITYYPIANLGADANYFQQQIYVYGVPNLVGRSLIDTDGIVDATETVNDDPNGAAIKDTRAMQYTYDTSANGLGADEAYLDVGDSGAPSFLDVNGSLALVGTHYYHSGTDTPMDGDYSGDTFLPYYIPQIEADLNGSGEQVTLTPEPGTGALIVGAGAAVMFRRPRRQSRHKVI